MLLLAVAMLGGLAAYIPYAAKLDKADRAAERRAAMENHPAGSGR